MIISFRVTEEEHFIIRKYAEFKGKSISEAVRKAILEKAEDEYDLRAYLRAKEEFEKDPITYSYDEVMKELGPF
jgi:uncharacterized protein (DUF1778 family)